MKKPNDLERHENTILSVLVEGYLWSGSPSSYEYVVKKVPESFGDVKALAGDFESISRYRVVRCTTISTYELIKEERP